MQFYYLTSLATSFLCLFVVGICICRLNRCKKRLRPRIKYTGLILAASVAGMQPYYAAQFPGAGALVMALCLIWLLVDGAESWRSYKDKEPQVLDTHIYDPDIDGEEND